MRRPRSDGDDPRMWVALSPLLSRDSPETRRRAGLGAVPRGKFQVARSRAQTAWSGLGLARFISALVSPIDQPGGLACQGCVGDAPALIIRDTCESVVVSGGGPHAGFYLIRRRYDSKIERISGIRIAARSRAADEPREHSGLITRDGDV